MAKQRKLVEYLTGGVQTKMAWKIIGSIVLAVAVVGVVVNFRDIKRYIRISTM
jgi:hypothetical protein